MRIRHAITGTLSLIVAATVQTAAGPLQQERQRTVSVLVLGRGDVPVTDLSERDFTIKEDGAVREVVRVTPAPPPAHIVLLVDDSSAATPALRELRTALNGFVSTMADESPAPAIRLTTFGDRPTVVADFSAGFSLVSRGIERVQPRPGSGATFLYAITETCRDLGKLQIKGALILAFVTESGPEFSNTQARRVADALRSAQASLWTITLQARDDGPGLSPESRERAEVIGDVTGQSGGRNDYVLTAQSLPAAFDKVASLLLSRYHVTYGRPERLIPPTKLEVTGRDRSWKLSVTRWPAE